MKITKKDLQALEAVRLGDPVSDALASSLVKKGLAYYIGGAVNITEKGRDTLIRYSEWGDNPLHAYDITFRATRPERPNLRTQTSLRIQGKTPEEAIEKARHALTADGWVLGEVMSAVKKFRVSKDNPAPWAKVFG